MSNRRLIASAVTDENGFANFEYTGVGAGELDFVAEGNDGSLVSETYEILDCLYTDMTSSDDINQNWNNSNYHTYNDGYATITASTSVFLRITTAITGDFEATFNGYYTNGMGRIVIYNASNTSNRAYYLTVSTDEVLYRIRRVNGTITSSYSTDNGTNWTDMTQYTEGNGITTEDALFGFIIATTTERKITYRNLKVYPI